jgi:hypothetical protein
MRWCIAGVVVLAAAALLLSRCTTGIRCHTKRYGDGGLKAHAKERLDQFVAGCVHLLPVEETIRLIKKARSLGL